MSYDETLTAVRTGAFSKAELAELGKAAYARVRRMDEAERMAKFAEIPDGAKVRVNRECTDRSIVGLQGEVTEHLYSNLRVKFDADAGRYAGRVFKCHPSILDVVS